MSVQKRISLLITGKVQGVGYRYSVKLKAESMAIRGYVRNQLDGSVFVTVQGENTAVVSPCAVTKTDPSSWFLT